MRILHYNLQKHRKGFRFRYFRVFGPTEPSGTRPFAFWNANGLIPNGLVGAKMREMME